MDELPAVIPIFPLPSLVLFPGVTVPLHIFEPRYREMVSELGDSGVVGMALLKGDWERDYYERPDIFTIGCAGRIGNLVRLPDGCFNLTLEGMREFRVERELRDRSFRRAQVEWISESQRASALDLDAMESLRELLVRYVGAAASEPWRAALDDSGLRDPELINHLCFYLDLAPLDKQTLLEALDQRWRCLLDVLTFRLEERKLGPAGSRGGSDIVQ